MNTTRLSKTLTAALNVQLSLEAQASQLYLSYGAWVHTHGLRGMSAFLFRHAQEERKHMMKILEYILERGGHVQITALPAPPSDPDSVKTCFEGIFTHEVSNTKGIYAVVKMSLVEEDWATWNFMQWFVKEQVEEEDFAADLLDRLQLLGGEKPNLAGLYELDKEMGKQVDAVQPVETAATDIA